MPIKKPSSLNGEWTGYRCYVTYLALKLHFTSPSYDFVKYGGKVSASPTSYETRRDRYQFEKLARHPDPFAVLLAHLSKDPKAWIGSISPTSDTYKEFVKRTDALPYTVKTDLGKLKESLDENLEVVDGQHPYLLSAIVGGAVSLETACILQALFNFVPYWDEAIVDPVIWPDNRLKIIKLMPFLEFDRAKMKEVVAEKIDL